MANVVVKPTQHLNGEVSAPPSKSYTQRMTIAAALSSGISKVSKPLYSEDTEATLRAVKALGAKVKVAPDCWEIQGSESLKASKEPIDCGESGATLRFMIPIAALADGPSKLTFRGSIERRPVKPLIASLKDLGAEAQIGKLDGKDTISVSGGGIVGGETSIPGDVSSQFISGLMFACPLARAETVVELSTPLESVDYVKMTQAVLSRHAVEVALGGNQIIIPGKQTYKAADACVPGDFSSAAFLLAAAAITQSNVTITNLDYETIQGDKAILTILKHMGVVGKVCRDTVQIIGSGKPLKPIELDARHIPDLVPVIAVLACYAKGTSTITGARRLRLKESDRLQSISEALLKMGAEVSVKEDGLTIKGVDLHGVQVDPQNDHRIAMAVSVAALGAKGETTIKYAECVRKSYPQFFTHLKQIGVDVDDGKLDR